MLSKFPVWCCKVSRRRSASVCYVRRVSSRRERSSYLDTGCTSTADKLESKADERGWRSKDGFGGCGGGGSL